MGLSTNPKTNLARCFRCEKNFNPIDMVMVVKRFNFVEAVEFLDKIEPIGDFLEKIRSMK